MTPAMIEALEAALLAEAEAEADKEAVHQGLVEAGLL